MNNKLLMYLIQCRDNEFIKRLSETDNNCYTGLYLLYKIAYANHILLMDEDFCNREFFNNIVIPCRKRSEVILHHLKSLIHIPPSFEKDFKEDAKEFAWFCEDDDFDYMLDGSLDKLMEKGYREIDCRLYEAGMKLNYTETESLLKIGANPDVCISGDFYPEEAVDMKYEDTYCLSTDVQIRFADSIDCYNLNEYWKTGILGQDKKLDDNQVSNVLQGASFRLMYLLIQKLKNDGPKLVME